MKIPDPIIVPTVMAIPPVSVIFLLSPTPSDFVLEIELLSSSFKTFIFKFEKIESSSSKLDLFDKFFAIVE